MHILMDLSFFFTNKIGDPHGEALGWIYSLSNNSFNYFLSSTSSSTDIR